MSNDTTREALRARAIEIARKHAKAKPQSYYAEPFQPHEWVIDALVEALAPSPAQAEGESVGDAEDAARYRWLRRRLIGADFAWGDRSAPALVFKYDLPVSANLDRMIDAARAKESRHD